MWFQIGLNINIDHEKLFLKTRKYEDSSETKDSWFVKEFLESRLTWCYYWLAIGIIRNILNDYEIRKVKYVRIIENFLNKWEWWSRYEITFEIN